jgi:acyl phosphate:glycerol-3-phosphate acyltransferase
LLYYFALLEQPFTENLLVILIASALGYLIGSIPFAYLFAKWRAGVDLRREGSGNIGTLNSYEVTGSKTVGILTLVADVLKGALPVWGAARFWSPSAAVIIAVAVVIGHCYPVWLRFKGGRGLATAAGTTMTSNLLLLVLWFMGYGIGLLIKRQVHVGAVIACLFTALAIALIPSWTIEALNLINISGIAIKYATWAMIFVILTRHVAPIMDLYRASHSERAANT